MGSRVEKNTWLLFLFLFFFFFNSFLCIIVQIKTKPWAVEQLEVAISFDVICKGMEMETKFSPHSTMKFL